MITARSAEMARLIMEEWDPTSETSESFALRYFASDTLADLEHALAIITELDKADEICHTRLGDDL